MSSTDFHFYIGFALAVSSTIFIGCSFIIKKVALRRLAATGIRAGDGGYQYLCDWVWWLGLILMGLGELANFAGYAFAPASLVTPMGGLSVLVSAVLSSHFLGERLNFIGKIGCIVCLSGSTVVVLHAPKEQEVQSLHELSTKVLASGFLTYAIIITVAGIISIFVIAPKFGTRSPLVYVFISGSIGSLSVMACKGIGLAIKEGIENGFSTILRQWIFWFFIIGLAFCLSVQLNYLNRALDIFNTSVVTPLLYVFFTAFVLLASAILFKEGASLTATDYIGNAVGLICIVSGIVLITLFKDINASLSELMKEFGSPMTNGEPQFANCKTRSSPSWCKSKSRANSESQYILLPPSTTNDCSCSASGGGSGGGSSSGSSSQGTPERMIIDYPIMDGRRQAVPQGLHQRTGSSVATFYFAPPPVTDTETYQTLN